MTARLSAAFFAAAFALAASQAKAQDDIASMFVESETGPVLSYIVEECGECGIAQFTCGDGGGIALTLLDFDDQTLSRMFAENGARATLGIGAASIEFIARQITFSEMSGSWDIEFAAWGNDASSLKPMALAERPVISTLKGEIALPAREGDAANARSFIDACLKR